MRLSRAKGIVYDVGSMNTTTRTQGVTEGPVYNPYHPIRHTMPEVGISHCPIPPMMNTLQDTCPLHLVLIPSRGVYTYPYIPPPVVPSPLVAQVEVNHVFVFTQ